MCSPTWFHLRYCVMDKLLLLLIAPNYFVFVISFFQKKRKLSEKRHKIWNFYPRTDFFIDDFKDFWDIFWHACVFSCEGRSKMKSEKVFLSCVLFFFSFRRLNACHYRHHIRIMEMDILCIFGIMELQKIFYDFFLLLEILWVWGMFLEGLGQLFGVNCNFLRDFNQHFVIFCLAFYYYGIVQSTWLVNASYGVATLE